MLVKIVNESNGSAGIGSPGAVKGATLAMVNLSHIDMYVLRPVVGWVA